MTRYALRLSVILSVVLLFIIAPLSSRLQARAQLRHRPNSTKPATSSTAGIITTYAGNGFGHGSLIGGFAGDGGAATSAELSGPAGIAIDSVGNMYIADEFNHRIRRVDAATGIITTVAGGGACPPLGYGYCGDNGLATSAALDAPQGVAVDSSGNIFIADIGTSTIRKVDAKTQIITTVAGFPTGCEIYPGTAIQVCGANPGYSGDGGPATMAQVDSPESVTVDAEGNLYISDTGSDAVRKVTASSGIITTIAGGGSGCAQQTDLLGDGCPATSASLSGPAQVAFDQAGNMYIADTIQEEGADDVRIREVNAQTGIITTYAGGGNGTSCAGETDNFGSGCPATDAVFNDPWAIAFDASGNLYISDSDVVREVDATTGIIQVVAGNGQLGFTGTGGPATSAELYRPYGIAFDSGGNLYFADWEDQVVRKVSAGTAESVAATPTFSPAPGTYSGTQSVILSDTTAGALIYYTIDGTTPTANSPQYVGAIPISSTTTISAYAAAAGYTNSAVATGTYTIETATATPAFSPAGGTFTTAQTVTLSDSTVGAAIYYTTDGSTPSASSTRYTAPITVDSTETISAIAIATGYTNSSIATATYSINVAQPAAAAPAFSPAGGTYTSTQTVNLTDATTGAAIFYTTNGSTPSASSARYTAPIKVSSSETISAIAIATGYTSSPIATATYTINTPLPTAATPVFSPTAGTYAAAQLVTITCATSGATIYFTVNGTTPTINSAAYTGPVSVAATETLSAIAIAPGYANSTVATASYVIDVPAPDFTVEASPATVSLTGVQAVTLGVTVTPVNGFNQPVAFTCSGLPSSDSCAFVPATVTPSGGPAQTSLTISTTTSSAVRRGLPSLWTGTSTGTLALAFAWFGWRRRRHIPSALLSVSLLVCLAAIAGCGTGSSSSSTATENPTTYTVTVTASSGSLSHTTTLSLTQ